MATNRPTASGNRAPNCRRSYVGSIRGLAELKEDSLRIASEGIAMRIESEHLRAISRTLRAQTQRVFARALESPAASGIYRAPHAMARPSVEPLVTLFDTARKSQEGLAERPPATSPGVREVRGCAPSY